jgi:hypothetical protein
MLAEQAFNGSSPHRITGQYSGYVLKLDTRTKREQSKRQKVRKPPVRASFAALADIYFAVQRRVFRGIAPGLTFAFRTVAAVQLTPQAFL